MKDFLTIESNRTSYIYSESKEYLFFLVRRLQIHFPYQTKEKVYSTIIDICSWFTDICEYRKEKVREKQTKRFLLFFTNQNRRNKNELMKYFYDFLLKLDGKSKLWNFGIYYKNFEDKWKFTRKELI